MLDVWALPRIDLMRLRRLLLGGALGAVLIGSGAYGAAVFVHSPAPPIKEKKKEKIIEVALTPTVEEEPAGGSEAAAPAALPMPQVRQKPVAQIQKVPEKAKIADAYEGDTGPTKFGTGGSGNGTGNGTGNGSGSGPPKVKVEAPPPPPEKPKAPKINPADYDPPKCNRRRGQGDRQLHGDRIRCRDEREGRERPARADAARRRCGLGVDLRAGAHEGRRLRRAGHEESPSHREAQVTV
jgi:hypothetical protein